MAFSLFPRKPNTVSTKAEPEKTEEQLYLEALETLEALKVKGVTFNRVPVSAYESPFLASFGEYDQLRKAPNTRVDYERKVGDPLTNSAVTAVINWIARTFPEAPLKVYKRDQNYLYHSEDEHALTELLDQPNEFYDGNTLWWGTIISWCVSGNAYWLKVFDKGTGTKLKELYYLPHQCIEPRWEDDNEFISYYEYRPGNGQRIKLKREEVVHLRHGVDPKNNRKGFSLLNALLREIFSDNESTNFAAALLNNMAVPGVIISPSSDDAIIEPDAAANIKAGFKKFAGDHRGEPLVLSAGVKLDTVQLTPAEMDMKMLHRLPEERITAVFGVPAIVVGLGAGLERSTMANFKEARELAYESNIIPTQNLMARQLRKQLLPHFEKDIRDFKLKFDLTEVRVLQDDENVKFQRWDIAVRGGWVTRNEARIAVGLKGDDKNNDVFLSGPNAGIDEFGNPVPGVASPAGLYNAQALRAARGNTRASGATVNGALTNPTSGRRNQQRGPHGRFMDVNGNPNDNSNGNENGPPRKAWREFWKADEIRLIYDYSSKHFSPGFSDKEEAMWDYLDAVEEEMKTLCVRLVQLNRKGIDPDNLPEHLKHLQYLRGKGPFQFKDTLTRWQVAMRYWIKAAHLGAAVALKGSYDFTDDEMDLISAAISEDIDALNNVTLSLKNGTTPLTEALANPGSPLVYIPAASYLDFSA